ncbi:EAL domain-containing protein [Mesorhizobium sp. M00.F.Ca.ET.186.01.1.1]|nr:EAL domain-containing protein [bacterium M00.F.Ca.ET.205.01.1.1]TGU50375.1 EAL domain-containing protein [bacterium M00.F.Ca.ET.152.01.1.1]TGV33850.1 EAL domain-containing protein [Mesorhizobium sp. M00.F.Ca.ET.186.01.1.1]TGZ40739.1 EAL domain-containing protein [bacterium M00.F.Ca.ET.162.01.1.1]
MARQSKKSHDGTRWQQALDRAHLGVWDWDLRSGNCFYSATWARMLGYSEDELANTSDLWFRLTHPDDRQQALASGDRHIAGLSDAIETELRLKHKQGHWVWVLDRGGIVERDANGHPIRLMGVQTDISKQKAAEAEREQVSVRFRLALAASGTGIWHHDIATRKSYWDTRTREIFGLVADTDEVTAELWHTYLHPDDKEATERAHQVPLGTDSVIASQYRIVKRDGETRHVESLVRFIAAGAAGQILGTVRDITEDKLREQELAYAACHDALTGLLNRAAFDRLLADCIATQRRLPLAIFYVDLDYFKALNDFAGHAAGDLALKSVAAGIVGCLPPSAHAARLGGDEFALLVPNCGQGEAERLAGAILGAVRDADLGTATSRKLAASVGIAFVGDRHTTVADALACADDACYAAKAAGRDRFAVFSAEAASGSGGLNAARLAADTVDAMEDGRLKLFGQQIHRLGRPWEESRHVEVLARLEGRGGRLIAPGEFIPAAERFGIAARLDRWIIRTALSRYGRDMASGAVTLGFNLSAQTLSDPQLWDFVDGVIDETGAPHSGIGFEITETAAVTNFDAAEAFVRKARERRCRVSLDDFGAGMSSFEYLRRFPVDAIKIDGSFIEHITESRFDREIVLAITSIARSLGCDVVGEKIERQDTAAMLGDMGVEFGQGFLLHRPEPLAQVVARAAETRTRKAS